MLWMSGLFKHRLYILVVLQVNEIILEQTASNKQMYSILNNGNKLSVKSTLQQTEI